MEIEREREREGEQGEGGDLTSLGYRNSTLCGRPPKHSMRTRIFSANAMLINHHRVYLSEVGGLT